MTKYALTIRHTTSFDFTRNIYFSFSYGLHSKIIVIGVSFSFILNVQLPVLTPNILELFKEYFISFKWDSLLCAVPPDEADQVLSEIKEAFKLPELIFAEPIQKYSDRFTVYKTKADQQVGNERLKY